MRGKCFKLAPMRTLDDYLRRKDAKRVTELSQELGVTAGRISQLRNATEWPPELALKIEAATNGFLSASKLSQVIAAARTS